MILANLAKAVREQNYYAVVLEFLIVIAGVVIGFQITAWNEDRQMRARTDVAIEQLEQDLHQMQSSYLNLIAMMETLSEHAQAAAYEIQACEQETSENLDIALMGHQVLPSYPDIRTAYNEMSQVGILVGLQDRSLKEAITNLYAEIDSAESHLAYFRDETGRAGSVITDRIEFILDETSLFNQRVEYNFSTLCDDIAFRNALLEVVDSKFDWLNAANDIMQAQDRLRTLLDDSSGDRQ